MYAAFLRVRFIGKSSPFEICILLISLRNPGPTIEPTNIKKLLSNSQVCSRSIEEITKIVRDIKNYDLPNPAKKENT